ncbi:MAG: hypothetical protein WCI93_01145 [bacterium]
MLSEKIGYIAVLIQLIGVSFYIRDMLRGNTKPNLVSWVVWALAPLIGSWLSVKAGAGLSVLPVFMAGFNPILVIIIAFVIKKGYWKITKFDIYCGVLAIFALFLWFLTNNFALSILFAIISDLLASIPTIVKSWNYPDTETSATYFGGIIANIVGLLIIKNWIFSIYALGLYFIVVNIIIVFAIYHKKMLYFSHVKK